MQEVQFKLGWPSRLSAEVVIPLRRKPPIMTARTGLSLVLTGAGSVTADTSAGTVSYTRPGGFDEAVIEFVVETSDGLTVGQTITDTSTNTST